MSFSTERESIYKWFQDNWNLSNGKIAWQNQRFDQPENELFLSFQILNFNSAQRSIGNQQKLYRNFGEVQVDIYIPQNVGVAIGRDRADKVINIFRNKVLTTSDNNTIQFRVPILRQLAPNEQRALNLEDILFRYLIRCPFYRDEVV